MCSVFTIKANSAFHLSELGKWVPASAGKAKAGMVHSVSGWMWGMQVKLWDPLRTRAIPERLRGVFTTRRYTNPHLPYLTLLCLRLVLFHCFYVFTVYVYVCCTLCILNKWIKKIATVCFGTFICTFTVLVVSLASYLRATWNHIFMIFFQ